MNRDGALVGDGNAIPGGKLMAKDMHAASKHLEPRRPARLDLVGNAFSRRQGGQVQASVLMNGERAIGTIG